MPTCVCMCVCACACVRACVCVRVCACACVRFFPRGNCFRYHEETRASPCVGLSRCWHVRIYPLKPRLLILPPWKPPGSITSRWQLLPPRPSSEPTGATSSVSAVHTSFLFYSLDGVQPFNDGRGECNHRVPPLLWSKHAPSNTLWRQGTFPWGSELLPPIFEPRAR